MKEQIDTAKEKRIRNDENEKQILKDLEQYKIKTLKELGNAIDDIEDQLTDIENQLKKGTEDLNNKYDW
jgi:DNA mismatch repair ATPase MutS